MMTVDQYNAYVAQIQQQLQANYPDMTWHVLTVQDVLANGTIDVLSPPQYLYIEASSAALPNSVRLNDFDYTAYATDEQVVKDIGTMIMNNTAG